MTQAPTEAPTQAATQAVTEAPTQPATVAPTTALKIGENLSDPLKMYLGDIYTVMINLAGLPAASVPCGFDSKGMPIGMHLIGNYFDETKILGAAHAYQQVTDWHKRKPAELANI